jgi:hypothetical protein
MKPQKQAARNGNAIKATVLSSKAHYYGQLMKEDNERAVAEILSSQN